MYKCGNNSKHQIENNKPPEAEKRKMEETTGDSKIGLEWKDIGM